MKLKLWQWEYDFDKEDAQIVVPLILLLLGLAFTALPKAALWAGGVTYYLLYFFLPPCFATLKRMAARGWHWMRFRCPYCKSRDVFLQRYEGYHSDEAYGFYLCNQCGNTSVEVRDRLLKAVKKPGLPIPPACNGSGSGIGTEPLHYPARRADRKESETGRYKRLHRVDAPRRVNHSPRRPRRGRAVRFISKRLLSAILGIGPVVAL